MRIHLELDPSRVLKTTSKGSSNAAIAAQPKLLPGQSAGGPLLKLGLTPDGQEDVVLIELQGELTFEGDSGGRTIGLLGFERPDRPTLHLGHHHLLHGKMVDLPRPYAVIRRVPAETSSSSSAATKRRRLNAKVDEDEDEDEDGGSSSDDEADDDDDKDTAPPPVRLPSATPSRPTASSSALPNHLLPPAQPTPTRNLLDTETDADADAPPSSSPIGAPTTARDYSSDLSSPMTPAIAAKRQRQQQKRKLVAARDLAEWKDGEAGVSQGGRTREYELVAMVRRKVVFSLRPEPIVTATILPE